MYCEACGRPVNVTANFCSNCGTARSSGAPSKVRSAPTAPNWIAFILFLVALGFVTAAIATGATPAVAGGYAVFSRSALDEQLAKVPIDPFVLNVALPAYNTALVLVIALFSLAAVALVAASISFWRRSQTSREKRPLPTVEVVQNGWAIAALVVAIVLAVFASGIVYVGWVIAAAGIALSILGLVRSSDLPRHRGRIMSWIALGLSVLYFFTTGFMSIYYAITGDTYGPSFTLWP